MKANLYFDALEAADWGDDEPLIERFRAMQRREAMKMSDLIPSAPHDAGPRSSIEDTIRRIGRKLEHERMCPNRRASITEKVEAVRDEAARQFDTLARQLRTGYRF